jgi:hypothetical protein
MKNIILAILFIFTAKVDSFGQTKPSANKIEVNQILGKWKLVEYRYGTNVSRKKSLTTCDSLTSWNFVQDSISKKFLLKCTNTDECKDYIFESEWILGGKNLSIKRTKIMGFGGISASGTFLIKEISDKKMVLDFQKNLYVFFK